MKKITLLFFVLIPLVKIHAQQKIFSLTKESLKDKIMGGWAGQTIGVTFGGPYEFRFQGTFIGDYQPLLWYNGYLKKTMIDEPGLYDDLYLDLTFVDVFEKYGLDAPADLFANAVAHAGYQLWHANQVGRYNILNGMKAPMSGHWKNNPHADCIDYQIESDFAGLMSPGMPNTASAISDKIGHIMNYGDGWYGGVYIGAMYSLTFISKLLMVFLLKHIKDKVYEVRQQSQRILIKIIQKHEWVSEYYYEIEELTTLNNYLHRISAVPVIIEYDLKYKTDMGKKLKEDKVSNVREFYRDYSESRGLDIDYKVDNINDIESSFGEVSSEFSKAEIKKKLNEN